MVLVKSDCSKFAHVFTAVCKTTTASIGDFKSAYGTFITGDFNDFDDIGVVFVPSHGKLHSFAEDCTFFIYTAAHGRLVSGDKTLGNVDEIFKELIFPRKTCHFTQHFIFQILHFGIKFTHFIPPLEITYLDTFAHFPEASRQLFN